MDNQTSGQPDLSERIKTFPIAPGVYIMKDASGKIIYVGKARSLVKRVSSYFQKKIQNIKTRVQMKNVDDIEYVVTPSEIEALLLEINLIKKHRPKYNIRLRDDKKFPYIAVTLGENYPRVFITRTIRPGSGDRYFGPYTDASAARNTLYLLSGIFRLKTCNKKLPLKTPERPCLNYQMKRCAGYCGDKISETDYRERIDNLLEFLDGNVGPVTEKIKEKMNLYAENQMYEKAAEMRDMIQYIQSISAKQAVSGDEEKDADYIGVDAYNDEAVVIMFEFRKGILLGNKINFYQNSNYTRKKDVLRTFLIEHYAGTDIPARIVLQYEINDAAVIAKYLSEKKGGRVEISPAVNDSDARVINLVVKNLDVAIAERHYSAANNDMAKGLRELQEMLSLKTVPDYIVCFDISNLQGTNSVASMSALKNGQQFKKGYRKFKIKGYEGADDPGMIHEAVARFLSGVANEDLERPDLVLIDGGPTQLTRAIEAAAALGFDIPVISIAKKMEEIFFDSKKPPLNIPYGSAPLKVLQNLRDEAHRFGVKYHRSLRSKETLKSELHNIPSIGVEKARVLLRHFKSVEVIKSADIESLCKVEGIDRRNAEEIYAYFHESGKE